MPDFLRSFICKINLSEINKVFTNYITLRELNTIIQEKNITHVFKKGDVIYIKDDMTDFKLDHLFIHNGTKFLRMTSDKGFILPFNIPIDFPANYWDNIDEHNLLKMKYDTSNMNLEIIKRTNDFIVYKDLNTNYNIIIYAANEELDEEINIFRNKKIVLSYVNWKKCFIYDAFLDEIDEGIRNMNNSIFLQFSEYIEDPSKTVISLEN